MPAVGSSSPWSGCQDTCCPSPVCVHLGVHPTRSAVRGPGVQPSGVQPVQCPVSWLPRPDAAVRPSGVQPVRRPAAWCPPSARSQPSRPASAGWSRWGTARDGGAAVTTGSSRVPCGPALSPAARSTARGGMDAGTAAEVVWRSAGERRPRTGRAVHRREAAPDRPGRPDRREGRARSLATALGRGSWLA
jgi:hypothetical protein